MAPTCRGRKPTLPPQFIEDHGWKMEIKERKWGRKDKYWKNLKTGKVCRSANEVKYILEAGGIYYTEPSTQAKGASGELRQEIPMDDVATDAAPEQNAVVSSGDIIDNNGHGDGGLAVAPPAGDIIGNNNAHHDGGQEEAAAQEQEHHGRRMKSFNLNVGIPGLWDD